MTPIFFDCLSASAGRIWARFWDKKCSWWQDDRWSCKWLVPGSRHHNKHDQWWSPSHQTDHHPQAILRHIWETSKNAEFFFLKNYPPALQKPFLKIQRVPPLDVEKKNSSNQVFIKAMLWHLFSRFQNGITLGYCKYFL